MFATMRAQRKWVGPFRGPGRLLSTMAAGLIFMLAVGPGCAHSHYRRVLDELDQKPAVRLAQRVELLASKHEQALVQFEQTRGLLADGRPTGAEAGASWVAMCQDALDQCAWWRFELARVSASLGDLVQSTDLADQSDAQIAFRPHSPSPYQHLRDTVDQAQGVMKDTIADLSETLESIQSAGRDGRTVNSGRTASAPDLTALRRAVDEVNGSAARLLTALGRDTNPSADNPVTSAPDRADRPQ